MNLMARPKRLFRSAGAAAALLMLGACNYEMDLTLRADGSGTFIYRMIEPKITGRIGCTERRLAYMRDDGPVPTDPIALEDVEGVTATTFAEGETCVTEERLDFAHISELQSPFSQYTLSAERRRGRGTVMELSHLFDPSFYMEPGAEKPSPDDEEAWEEYQESLEEGRLFTMTSVMRVPGDIRDTVDLRINGETVDAEVDDNTARWVVTLDKLMMFEPLEFTVTFRTRRDMEPGQSIVVLSDDAEE